MKATEYHVLIAVRSVNVRTCRAVCRRWMRRLAALTLALAAFPALAAGVFVVNYPWARPAAKGAATEVFMELTAVDGGALVGAHSTMAGSATLVGPGKSTASVDRLALAAGAPVMLMPGSYRVRLSGLTRPLKLDNIAVSTQDHIDQMICDPSSSLAADLFDLIRAK